MNTHAPSNRFTRTARSTRRAHLGAALAVPVLLLSLAACAPASKSAGGSTSPDKSTAGSFEDKRFDWELKVTQCLRDEGIEITDPDKEKGVGEFVQDDAFTAAFKVCSEKIGDPPLPENRASDEEMFQESLKATKCLRENGVDIADPPPEGGVHLPDVEIPESVLEKCL